MMSHALLLAFAVFSVALSLFALWFSLWVQRQIARHRVEDREADERWRRGERP